MATLEGNIGNRAQVGNLARISCVEDKVLLWSSTRMLISDPAFQGWDKVRHWIVMREFEVCTLDMYLEQGFSQPLPRRIHT